MIDYKTREEINREEFTNLELDEVPDWKIIKVL